MKEFKDEIDRLVRADDAPTGVLQELQDALTAQAVSSALVRFRGNQTRAAAFLGINRGTLRKHVN